MAAYTVIEIWTVLARMDMLPRSLALLKTGEEPVFETSKM
jgi:hypothetical protein